MRKYSWVLILIIPIIIVAVFLIARQSYYGAGSSAAYSPPDRPISDVKVEVAARSERLEAVDNPTVSEGVVVIDYTHSNAFFVEELNTLFSKIVARGFSYEIVLTSEDSDKDAPPDLIKKLRYANALVLAVPRIEYTPEEILEIERFVERGGRVFIIGDPTRTVVVEALNSIAGSFGIIFSNDYLYSLEQNDNNYRNVVYTNFADSPLTKGLDDDSKVILYSSSSINAPGHEIILGDETTKSSTSEGGRDTAAAAVTMDGQVLAVGDLTFFAEPYSAAENNGILINNIADFLTSGRPQFKLTDFPFFFNSNVDIVFDDPLVFNSQFEDAAKLKEFLETQEHTVSFVNEIGSDNDAIFIGRYDNIESVEEYLTAANIAILEPEEEDLAEDEAALADAGDANIDDADAVDEVSFVTTAPVEEGEEARFIEGRVQIEGVGDLERGGSTLFYLHQEDDRNILIVLSDDPDTNADAFEILLKNQLIECQAAPQIAVCQTADPDEELPPSLRSTRIDKILIVSDDDGREREDAQTSALEYTDAFSASTYNTTVWETSKDGPLDLDQLLEYDAVIWSTGDYWDDSIGQEETALLTEYLQVGGNLLLSGASIAFDWDHTEFLSNVAHVDYLDFAEQKDLAVDLVDHSIANDFDADTAIDFVETPSGETLLSDVVNHSVETRVIFRRGPESDAPGAPAVIIYEDDRVKVAYYTFPVYLLPSAERALLVNNTIDWFTRKVEDLPEKGDYEPFETEKSDNDDSSADGEEGAGDESGDENSGDEEGGDDSSGGDDGGEDKESDGGNG